MKNSEINKTFLNTISLIMKETVLSNVAKHYGITNSEAFDELIDEDAENIMDYLTGNQRQVIHVIYNQIIK
jgi:hypothetical protein